MGRVLARWAASLGSQDSSTSPSVMRRALKSSPAPRYPKGDAETSADLGFRRLSVFGPCLDKAPTTSSYTPALPATGLDTVIGSYYEVDGVDLLRALLHYDPSVRMTPEFAISHRYFHPRASYRMDLLLGRPLTNGGRGEWRCRQG